MTGTTLIDFIKENFDKNAVTLNRISNSLINSGELKNYLIKKDEQHFIIEDQQHSLLKCLKKHYLLYETKTLSAFFANKGLKESQYLQIIKHSKSELLKEEIISISTDNSRDRYLIENEIELEKQLENNAYYKFYLELKEQTLLKNLLLSEGLEIDLYELKEKIYDFEGLFRNNILKRVVNSKSKASNIIICDKEALVKILDSIFFNKEQYTTKCKMNNYLINIIGFNENQCKIFRQYSKELLELELIFKFSTSYKISDHKKFHEFVINTDLYKFLSYKSKYKTTKELAEMTDNPYQFLRVIEKHKHEFLADKSIVEVSTTGSKKKFLFCINENTIINKVNSNRKKY